jgi:hypothetical protein
MARVLFRAIVHGFVLAIALAALHQVLAAADRTELLPAVTAKK